MHEAAVDSEPHGDIPAGLARRAWDTHFRLVAASAGTHQARSTVLGGRAQEPRVAQRAAVVGVAAVDVRFVSIEDTVTARRNTRGIARALSGRDLERVSRALVLAIGRLVTIRVHIPSATAAQTRAGLQWIAVAVIPWLAVSGTVVQRAV